MGEQETQVITVIPYQSALKLAWDNFNKSAANGLFLFDRDYLEYHQDRFNDHSLLFYQEEELVAICPLNTLENTAYSHGGLTFGGLLVQRQLKIHRYLQCFAALLSYLKDSGFQKIIYKQIPYIFHQAVALEDLYALNFYNAKLLNRNLSSFIDLSSTRQYSKGRKWSLQQALKSGLEVTESTDYAAFMDLVHFTLTTKYAVKPTHTTAEMIYLAQKFPENIKLLAVYRGPEIIGGSIIYLSTQVVHLQYIATNDAGKKQHVLDLIVHYIIQKYKSTKKYLSFGISPGDDEFNLNTGLVQNKESFGARSLMHDIYEISL